MVPRIEIQYVPYRKAKNPIQAHILWIFGLSQKSPALPMECRNVVETYIMKKRKVNTSAIAISAAVPEGGGAKMEPRTPEESIDVSMGGRKHRLDFTEE